MTPPFAELCTSTHYSFLHGASSPADMVLRAMELGMAGIGIADRNSVAGVVRAHVALRTAYEDAEEEGISLPELKLVVGSRLVFSDTTPDIIVYPLNRCGWGKLTRLLSTGNLRAEKGGCILTFADLEEFTDNDMALIFMTEKTPCASEPYEKRKREVQKLIDNAQKTSLSFSNAERIGGLRDCTPHIWLGATMPHTGSDMRYLAQLAALSRGTGIPLLATNDPLYASAQQRPLNDILTCIAEKTTIAKAGRLLRVNAERHLKAPDEMARLFRDYPEAIGETQKLLDLIDFTLDDLSYHYPDEPVPMGWTPQGWLEQLTWNAAHEQHPDDIPESLQAKISEELQLIKDREYAPYFLTVHDIVKWARDKDILCQGRGSAANSAVCYLLGITSVDPVKNDLLFSRFISEERREPPDIDVDFEHERREEVIQYIYERYGRHRAGIAATVVHYRSRSAIREVGKALGLSEDITSRLSSTVWGSYSSSAPDKRFKETGLDPESPEIKRLGDLVQQILQFPRHLSQHVGGFVLTQDRLDETVPIHNAAMEDRTFIEWDKDDIDALGLMKVDVLALGMLTCIRKCFDLMEEIGVYPDTPSPLQGGGKSCTAAKGGGQSSKAADTPLSLASYGPELLPTIPKSSGRRFTRNSPSGERERKWSLTAVPTEDSDTYDMLCKGDSIGVFQVESRAQINMLPRLRPREFYDLVIQVAIVRPGPIEGDMVHPYLRRRSGIEKTIYPKPNPPHPPDELRGVLGRTHGVPLFQEQAMKLAIVAAEFSDSDANKLRRAMATFRNVGTIHHFQEKMIDGMVARGYERDFAERCYKQIEGFGSYGFPESHAQSFAILVYISSWIKCHHPAVFAAAILNSQPMGFYAPAQLVRDAREHGVEVREIDVNHSDWDNGVEAKNPLPFRGEGRAAEQRRVGRSVLASPAPPLPASPLKGRGEDVCLRLGFRQIDGFREAWAEQIMAARPFRSIEELARKADLPSRALRLLADADAMRSLGLDRRQALWEVRRTPSSTLPLFEAADACELGQEPDTNLPAMTKGEHVVTDYQSFKLSLKGHPMEFLRETLRADGILSCAELAEANNGSFQRVAGVVLIRQRPGKGNAIFITLEDETGVSNLLLWASRFEKMRRPVMAARLMIASGEVQKSREGVIHLMVSRIEDATHMLDDIAIRDRPAVPAPHVDAARSGGDPREQTPIAMARADEVKRPVYRNEDKQAAAREKEGTIIPQPVYPRHGHPRNVRILPKSRDFH